MTGSTRWVICCSEAHVRFPLVLSDRHGNLICLFQERRDPSQVTALSLVNAAREYRRGIVQTKEQYVYVTRAIESMKDALASDSGSAGAM